MSPDKKLLMAIFGSAEDQAKMRAEAAAQESVQLEQDVEKAKRVAEMATKEFNENVWAPALLYGWQACAVATDYDGAMLCAQMYGDNVGVFSLSEYDIENAKLI